MGSVNDDIVGSVGYSVDQRETGAGDSFEEVLNE